MRLQGHANLPALRTRCGYLQNCHFPGLPSPSLPEAQRSANVNLLLPPSTGNEPPVHPTAYKIGSDSCSCGELLLLWKFGERERKITDLLPSQA